MGFILVGSMVGAARVDAASLTLDWAAPTTNADGTRLTDLGSYRIYLGTSSPACPSASFFTVASPTSSPASGQTLSRVVSSLSAGTTYFARVTAVDTSGNESTCSASASGVAKADFSVTPSTTTSFGSVAVNTTVDRTFTVQNTSTISISGTASIGAPYSIQSGGSFSLAAGASQTVTVRFRPTSSGTFAGNVNFVAGGDTVSRAVTGSGTGSAPATVTLSVTKNGSGSGTVTGTPAGISCGATCSQSVTAGTARTLTASPAAGSTFAGWGGACSGTGTCAVTVNVATTVTATFNLASAPSTPPGMPGNPTATLLSTDASGATFAFAWTPGSGATSYAYTTAFSDGSGSQQGTVATPALQLKRPYHVSGAASSGFVCVRSVNSAGQTSEYACGALTVPARQAAPSSVVVSVTKSGSGVGTVTTVPSGIACGATCSQTVLAGTSLTLTATPASGSTFAGWGGACSGTGTCTITVNATTAVTAAFNRTPVTLSVSKTGSGSGTITGTPAGINCGATCSQSVTPGTALTLTAAPAPGSTFAGWSGACSGTGSCAVTVNAATTATATFNLAAVPSTPPGAPGNPSVTLLSTDATGATFAFAWSSGSGATSYAYMTAFSDGSASQQGTVTTVALQLKRPYHVSGATSPGFICFRSVNWAGQTSEYSCSGFTVPAR